MSMLIDVYFKAYRAGGGGSPSYHIPSHEKALLAVADAAIAADRAARAEQSARLQAMGMSAGAASDYVEFVSHRQHCAIRHGLDACTCDYAKAAAPPAAPVVPEGMVLVPAEVVEFLRGAAPLEGVWFGDRHPTESGAFWWRKRLAAAPVPSQDNGGAA